MAREMRTLYIANYVLFASLGAVQGILPHYYSSAQDGMLWVVSTLKNESHAMACRRAGALPISSDIDSQNIRITWNADKVAEVAKGLDCYNAEDWRPLQGCCTPGLWFNKESGQCFTHLYSTTFANYGWFDSDNFPVYSCSMPTNDTSGSISIDSAYYSSTTESVAIYGSGISSLSPYIELGNQFCSNSQVCGDICLSCQSNEDACSVGSICLDMWGNGHRCYPYCAGDEDTSCPCGSTCITVSVHSQDTSDARNIQICLPIEKGDQYYYDNDAACEAFSKVGSNGSPLESVTCKLPTISSILPYTVLKSKYSKVDMAAVEVTITSGQNNFGSTEYPLTELKTLLASCINDADCFDGDICTIEHCSQDEGKCIVVRQADCVSSSRAIQQQQTPYKYLMYTKNAPQKIADFEERMRCRNVSNSDCFVDWSQSTISSVDDYPSQTVALQFDFPYFGNVFSTVSLNPNGLLQLPPVLPCEDYTDSFKCIVYSTQSNVISLWASDWDFKSAENSSVSYAFSTLANGTTTARSAVHVLYANAVRWTQDTRKKNMSTFSASLYDDGSMVVRYHSVSNNKNADDVFGLQGNRLSSTLPTSNSLAVRYHSESIDASLVKDSTELTFCLANSIGCIVSSCVSANETIDIRWGGHSCDALSGNVSLWCAFGGGLAYTTPTFLTIDNSHKVPGILRCPVPEMPLADGTIFAVDIVFSVGINPSELTSNDGASLSSLGTVRGVYRNQYNEIAHASLMGRYYGRNDSADVTRPQCGCSPLPAFTDSVCDALLVCGGVNETKDCAGTAFGSAYYDSCGTCAGGTTRKIPSSGCSSPPPIEMLTMKLFTQVLVLVGVVFLASLTVSSMSYYIRMTLLRRGLVPGAERFAFDYEAELARIQNESLATAQPTAGRGLSSFECDALGEIKYNKVKSSDKDLAGDIEMGELAKLANKEGDHSVDIAPKTGKSVQLQLEDRAPGTEADPDSSMEPLPTECSICLVDFEIGEECRKLPEPCGHLFHKRCIDRWFQVSAQCPMCKRSIRQMLYGEDHSTGSESSQNTGSRSASGASANVVNVNLRQREIEHILDLLHGHSGRRHSHRRGFGLNNSSSSASSSANSSASDGNLLDTSTGSAGASQHADNSDGPADAESVTQLRRSIIMNLMANIGRGRRSSHRYNRVHSNDSSASSSRAHLGAGSSSSSSSSSNPMHPSIINLPGRAAASSSSLGGRLIRNSAGREADDQNEMSSVPLLSSSNDNLSNSSTSSTSSIEETGSVPAPAASDRSEYSRLASTAPDNI
jgi:hypothetical protein